MNNLLKLISIGENERLEFKESPRLKEEICQAVSAFSNANGGSILIGVSDSGTIIGNERQKKAIGYLRRNERITNKEYQEINKTTKKTATRDLQELVGLGFLIKSGRTGRGVHYVLNPTYKGDTRGHKGTKNLSKI